MAKTPPNFTPDQRAVIDAVRGYVAAFSSAEQNGRVERVEKLVVPSCNCTSDIAMVKKAWSHGHAIKTSNYATVDSWGVPKISKAGRLATLNVTIDVAEEKELNERGTVVQTNKAIRGVTQQYSLSKGAEVWKIEKVLHY